MSVQYVTPTGLLRIAFSEKFIVPANITVLKDWFFGEDGQWYQNLELLIYKGDADDENDGIRPVE